MLKRIISALLAISILIGLIPILFENEASAAPSATAAKITELFNARSKNQHPRLFATNDDFARVRKLLETDPYLISWYSTIYQYGVSMLTQPVYKYELPDGKRLLSVSRSTSYLITYLAFLYQISGEARFANRAIKEMLNVCSYSDWNPVHFLDVSQMAYGVAIGYDWLYHYMTDAQRKTVCTTIYKYAIVESQSDQDYKSKINNWNSWCNGGMTLAALSIFEDYPSACANVLSEAITTVQLCIDPLSPSGSYPEGPSYSQVGMSFMIYMFESLDSVLGTDFGLSELDGVKEFGKYWPTVNGEKYAFNHGDGSSTIMTGSILFWYAKKFNMPELAVYQRSHMQGYSQVKDLFLAMLWYDPSIIDESNPAEIQRDYMAYSDYGVSVASFRSFATDPRQIFAAIKSGNNETGHTHLDIGTFVLDAMGERWIEDLGKDNYNLSGYFGSTKRWNYYKTRAEGQNTLVINPDSTGGQGYSAKCQISGFRSGYDGGFVTINMQNAYESYGATAAKRSMLLFDDRSRVLVRDEVTCSASSTIYWFAHTKAKITLSSDRKSAELSLNGKKMLVQIASPSGAIFSTMNATALSTSPKPSGEDDRSAFRKLAIKLTGVKTANIAVVFTPIFEESDRNKSIPTEDIASFASLINNYKPGTTLTPNAEGVYEIYDAEQLIRFSAMVRGGETFAGKTVRLMNDIDLECRSISPIGGFSSSSDSSGNAFKGTFDGNYHTIKNLFIYQPYHYCIGLFGTASSATIKNLGIESGTIFGRQKTGGLIGVGNSVTVTGCYSNADIIGGSGLQIGGLVGQTGGTSTYTNCYVNGKVRSNTNAGGVVGTISSKSTINVTNCYYTGIISGPDGTGLIGNYATSGTYVPTKVTVKNCYATCNIKNSSITANSSIESYSGCVKLSKAKLTSAAIDLGSAYIYDCEWENDGYPVFQWQCDTVLPADNKLFTAAELRLLAYQVNSGINNFSGQTVTLAENIDLDSREWIPIGGNSDTDTNGGRVFKGTFDGQGHYVRNLKVSTSRYYTGFFGSAQGTIQNFGIQSGQVIGYNKTAGICGGLSGTITNCYNRASISGNSLVGGIIGMTGKVAISNCYNTGNVTATHVSGGLIGYISSSGSDSTFDSCYNAGTISGSTFGAIVGSINASCSGVFIRNCHGITGTALVGSSTSHTGSVCSYLSATELKEAAPTLGSAFLYDKLQATNGGYPILLNFVYSVQKELTPDADGIYRISTADELHALSYMVNVLGNSFEGKTIELCADIDLKNEEFNCIGGNTHNQTVARPFFSGTFDGCGHTISNVSIRSGNYFVGFFGNLSGATIKRLGIASGYIVGISKVGGIAGTVRSNTLISECYNAINISGTGATGGIAGMIGGSNIRIENCYNSGNIDAPTSTGGIVGYFASDASNSKLLNCMNVGEGANGIVGSANEAVTTVELKNCHTVDTAVIAGTANSLIISGSKRVPASELQSYAATLGSSYAEDFFTQNALYPVLQWQNGSRRTQFITSNGVNQITCADDLRLLSYYVGKGNNFSGTTFEMTSDIDLENIPYLPIGGNTVTSGGSKVFSGTFDGKGHIIRNLKIASYHYNVGLFGYLSKATVRNLGIENGIVASYYRVGSIAGVCSGSTISGCYSKAQVYGKTYIGGLVGSVSGSSSLIENCYHVGNSYAAALSSTSGGLAGYVATDAANTRIINSYHAGIADDGLIASDAATATTNALTNCYTVGTPVPVGTIATLDHSQSAMISDEMLRSYATILGSAFETDADNRNQGYPVLTWETGSLCFHVAVIDPAVAPTCTAAGKTEGKHCSVCNAVLVAQQTISAKGHTEVIDKAVAATCTTAGKTEGKHCSVCNAILVAQESIAGLGHDPIYTNNGADHTVTCSRCDMAEVKAHAYTDNSCICGAKEDPYLDPGLVFYNKSMDLQSYIGVNYLVRNSVAADYDRFYVTVKREDGTVTVLNGTVLGASFTYFSIRTAAPQMTETLSATILAIKDGEIYHGETVNWSVRDGVMEQMNALTDLTTEANRNRMTLMADMLNYGAAAQIRFEYRTDDLANNKMTDAQLAYASTGTPTVDAAIEEITNNGATVKFINKSLSLQSSIEIQLMVNIKGFTAEELEARIVYGDTTDVVELKAYGSTYAQIIYDGIAAKDVREYVEITVYSKATGKAVSNTLRCSIEALAAAMLPNQADIVYAMMRYGNAAKEVYG